VRFLDRRLIVHQARAKSRFHFRSLRQVTENETFTPIEACVGRDGASEWYCSGMDAGHEFDLRKCLDAVFPGLSLSGEILHQAPFGIKFEIGLAHIVP
jgi:hypothetical protein